MSRVGRKSNIDPEVFAARFEIAFTECAKESGTIPRIDDVVHWDLGQGNTPPLPRSAIYTRMNSVGGDHSPELLEEFGPAIAYAASIGIRNAVIIDGATYQQEF
jgi:hypothetical protein